MDWLTFISKIIESVAWPAAAVLLVALLRDEIRRLVPFIKKVKAGPVEAEFERDIKQLKESAPQLQAATEGRPPSSESKSFLFQLAELHPRSAILESWVRVEAAARASLAKVASSSTNGYIPAARLAEPLVQNKIINQAQVTLFHELRRLRNDVAHAQGFEPTLESARAYIDLSQFLASHIEGAARDT